MTNNILPSLEKLPTELLHRIFDHLDAETLFFSIRPVCRLFRSVVNAHRTYNHYAVNMRLMSKSNFYALCRWINPSSVHSLILSNEKQTSNQITWFLSLVQIPQFTSLRSLILIEIDSGQLNSILNQINLTLLTLFSFSIRTYSEEITDTTYKLLESTIGQPTLRELRFCLDNNHISQISWPINCRIKYLTIKGSITMDNLAKILQHSSHLHTLILKGDLHGITSRYFVLARFQQLRSFTFEPCSLSFDVLEALLPLTPSLVYMKLIGICNISMLVGNRWKRLIETNLTHLSRFEFYFSAKRPTMHTKEIHQMIMSSFQTPFWLEETEWFCNYEFDVPSTYPIRFYSLPICVSEFVYTSNITTLTNYSGTVTSNQSLTKNLRSLKLPLYASIAHLIEKKNAATNYPMFPQVTDLHLEFQRGWSSPSLTSLSSFIDMSRIIAVEISSTYFYEYSDDVLFDLKNFLKELLNLSILTINDNLDGFVFNRRISGYQLHLLMPRHVQHLRLQTDNLNQIKKILERCQQLVTITVNNPSSAIRVEICHWFAENTENSTCVEVDTKVIIWLGKIKTQFIETCTPHKRIKLTHDG